MVCACSLIANATNKKSIIPQLNLYTNHPDIVKLRSYIESHPKKDLLRFKQSMVAILVRILKSLE
jgi:hypothetical protein